MRIVSTACLEGADIVLVQANICVPLRTTSLLITRIISRMYYGKWEHRNYVPIQAQNKISFAHRAIKFLNDSKILIRLYKFFLANQTDATDNMVFTIRYRPCLKGISKTLRHRGMRPWRSFEPTVFGQVLSTDEST